jgi:hypothetical protein
LLIFHVGREDKAFNWNAIVMHYISVCRSFRCLLLAY